MNSEQLEDRKLEPTKCSSNKSEEEEEHKIKILWSIVFGTVLQHLSAGYGLYLMFTEAKTATIMFAFCFGLLSELGMTAGVHRLWSHRAYKAKLPLRIFLAIFQTATAQRSILWWSANHRVHHKFTETNADPHNANRGFFFSHIGWLLCEEHPEVERKRKTIDVSDLEADPVVRIQYRYYTLWHILLNYLLPPMIPYYFFDEKWTCSFFTACVLPCIVILHVTFSVNSISHMWGYRPYDKKQGARDNDWVVMYLGGEGNHNFHHTFPQDYASNEFGWRHNICALFIQFMAAIGQAYDLKTASPEIIKQMKEVKGEKQR